MNHDDIDARIRSVMTAQTENFVTLVALAGLRPQRDFRYADLRNVDLSDQDLAQFDFRGADLTGANLKGARLAKAVLDETTLISPEQLMQTVDLPDDPRLPPVDRIDRVVDVLKEMTAEEALAFVRDVLMGPDPVSDKVASRLMVLTAAKFPRPVDIALHMIGWDTDYDPAGLLVGLAPYLSSMQGLDLLIEKMDLRYSFVGKVGELDMRRILRASRSFGFSMACFRMLPRRASLRQVVLVSARIHAPDELSHFIDRLGPYSDNMLLQVLEGVPSLDAVRIWLEGYFGEGDLFDSAWHIAASKVATFDDALQVMRDGGHYAYRPGGRGEILVQEMVVAMFRSMDAEDALQFLRSQPMADVKLPRDPYVALYTRLRSKRARQNFFRSVRGRKDFELVARSSGESRDWPLVEMVLGAAREKAIPFDARDIFSARYGELAAFVSAHGDQRKAFTRRYPYIFAQFC